ncbi:MAG TPA: aldehyde dehydrogenase family protein [Nocardioidaceae bacterium]|nr:aldehyde dehydrogenase family protein [Nocardioidaceae bacterium]
MTTTVAPEAAIPMSLEEHFSRNLIGGQWKFPAGPFEYEIRSPADSQVIAVVPLSSRFDVTDAVEAARTALRGTWADREVRARLLRRLLDQLTANEQEIARVQSAETGLTAEDSLTAVRLTLREARSQLRCEAMARAPKTGGVSGHILSWGLPFTEVVTSVFPALVRGDTVVIKPSLRAPLSAVVFGYLATETGLHPGVVNVVQGTGGDVGAELVSRPDLSGLYVRAGERTLQQAERAHAKTLVPLRTVRAGGNAVILGPGALEHLDEITEFVSTMVRMNSAGGPFNVPMVVAHTSAADEVLGRVISTLSTVTAAPLPTETLRASALAGIRSLLDAGAVRRLGGDVIPDDIPHRMGWRVPPTVLDLGNVGSAAAVAQQLGMPLGPVLGVVRFDATDELAHVSLSVRAKDGVAHVWGLDLAEIPKLPHRLVVTGSPALDYTEDMRISPSWTEHAQ